MLNYQGDNKNRTGFTWFYNCIKNYLYPRHIIIKMAKFKDKERILKAAREKQEVTYNEALIRLTADFSTETL